MSEPTGPGGAELPGESPGLRRALGPLTALAVVVGNVIGSGIFLKPGNIALESGSFPLIIAVWCLGGLLCILGALCFAELATMLPHAGGMYVYLREAYGRLVAFLFGWSEFLFARPASIGALAVAFVGSWNVMLGWSDAVLRDLLVAVALITAMAWINIVGVLWGGRVQLVTTAVKVLFLALVALIPWLLLPLADSVDLANFATTAPPRQPTLAMQVGAVLLAVMWAYNGWHGVTPLTEEIQHPQRNIPLSLFLGIGILILLYVAANFAYHGVLTMSQMQEAGNHAAEKMLRQLCGPAGQSAMSLVIMCSTFGAINTNLLQSPRITFAMGRDGTFFRDLGRVHATYRTPAVAIACTSLMSSLLVLAVAVAKLGVRSLAASSVPGELPRKIVVSLQGDSMFELLTNFVIFSASIFYMLAVLAVIVLRFKLPRAERPYRTWGYPVVPVAFLASYVWFMLQIYHSKPLESLTGLALIALGIPAFWLYRRMTARLEPPRRFEYPD
ncbi:MAG: amino acid permease [Pirellulaceae bacterium]|nr:amino acid permease [Pirellulaceae bacterium]